MNACKSTEVAFVPHDASPTSAMIIAAQNGDEDAMDAVLRSQLDYVYAISKRSLRDTNDVDNAVQNTLMKIFQKLHQFNGCSKFSTWVYRIAVNSVVDEVRRLGRSPVPIDELDENTDDTQLADQIVTRLRLEKALRAVPDLFTTPVIMRDIVGCTYRDISLALDIPQGTVKSRIARGRTRLADILQEEEQIDGELTAA